MEEDAPDYEGTSQIILEITKEFGDSQPSLIHALWALRNLLSQPNFSYFQFDWFREIINCLVRFSLVNFIYASKAGIGVSSGGPATTYLELSENGKRFLVQLSMNKNNEKTRALSLSRRFKL